MFRPDLTPAQHVARREALAQVARGSDLGKGIVAIKEKIILPLGEQFLGGTGSSAPSTPGPCP